MHRFLICLLFGLTIIPSVSFGFGAEGHRITGHIAEALLTPKARIRLHQITGGATLDQLATYMDEQKNRLGPRIRRWHYDNQLICSTAPITSYCPSGDCASRQIEQWERVLKNASSSDDDRERAMLFLSHLVGDIHQPLHAADNEDRGGNSIQVAGPNGGYSKNLHGLWDSDFVKRQVRGMSEEAFAKLLLREYRDRIPGWQGGSAQSWLQESHRYAVEEAYGQLPGFSCQSGSPTVVEISPAYREMAERRVREQLAKAGARLAYVVNQALDFSGAGHEPNACTMDAKQCADGSWVSRVGPRCEFALCPR